jgi:branched-chain amino acid transport system ATP-binding protein
MLARNASTMCIVPGEERPLSQRDAELTATDITVRFGGVTALDHVTLRAAGQEVLGIIGPNGAGKTTLFNVVCGFVAADEGSLVWDGQPLGRPRPHQLAKLGIARTLQGVGLFARLTALENVMAGAHAFRRSGFAAALLALPRADRDERELRAAALAALKRLGVQDVASRLPSELPYPVQKRVALARALVGHPRMLLLDEPAGGLGGDDLTDLGDTIRELRRDMGVMLVEHHMDLVMSVCDRVMVLDFGSVISEGTPDDVRSDQRVLEAYLGFAAGDVSPDELGGKASPAAGVERGHG